MRVSTSEVEEDPYDPSSYLHDGVPYTGDVHETTAAGVVVEEFSVLDGRLHGVARSWYADGTPKTEARFDHGRAVGTARSWHPNGRPADERDFDDRGRNVSGRRWSADGTLEFSHPPRS